MFAPALHSGVRLVRLGLAEYGNRHTGGELCISHRHTGCLDSCGFQYGLAF